MVSESLLLYCRLLAPPVPEYCNSSLTRCYRCSRFILLRICPVAPLRSRSVA